jgi:hypothetical protein
MRINKLVRSVAFAALALAPMSIYCAGHERKHDLGVSGTDCCAARRNRRRRALRQECGKNRAGLLDKLDNASRELDRVKLCDTIGKLTDFRYKVNQLIASGSINTDPTAGTTGQDLVDGANEAIACVQSLVTQSRITCPTIE